jgi:hypothetical protein
MLELCIAPDPWLIHTAPSAQKTTPTTPRIHTTRSDLFEQFRLCQPQQASFDTDLRL